LRRRYRFILLSNDDGERLELLNAPQGWDAQKFTIVRDLVYLGVLKNITVEYEFVGDGFEFLQRRRLHYGMDADVMLRVYRTNPNQFVFEGKVNYENFAEDRKYNKFKVDIVQSSLLQKFQNREDVELNVLNNISLDRLAVVPAELKNALVRGRKIEFYSEFDGSVATEPEIYAHTLPFLVKKNGNDGVNTASYTIVPPPSTGTPEVEVREQLYAEDAALYVNKLITPQSIIISFQANLTINYSGEVLPILLFGIGDLVMYMSYKIVYRICLVDETGVIVDELYNSSFVDPAGNFDLSFHDTVTVPVGHRVVFACERWSLMRPYEDGDPQAIIENEYQLDGGDAGDVTGTRMRVEISYNSLLLTIKTNSEVPDSTHPVLLPHELFTNLMKQINGGTFYSDYFGREDIGYYEDGPGAYLSITTGELLRGIPPDEIQIATSMRRAFTNYHKVECLGAIVTETGIRIESLDYLFNNNICADVGEVADLEIGPSKEFIFNSVKAGYPVNEYEEENGRDEPNTTYQFTNGFKSVKKELDLLSDYFGDGYGIEFARRQSVITTGTKDTKYDGKIFFLDCLMIDGVLTSRRLEGILDVEGIFSPGTAMNLRIAVGQNMLRHKKFLNIPLHKKNKVYHFQSKAKNTGLRLITDLGITNDGEDIVTGSTAYFLPEERRFKCPLTLPNLFGILANPLGLVKYTYKKERFYDLIMEAGIETDRGGRTTWRVLGTRDTPVEVTEDPLIGDFIKYGPGVDQYLKYAAGAEDIVKYGSN
jgi:hypothetical protein